MKIETGFPIPNEGRGLKKYPFAEMNVGDSIVVDGEKATSSKCKAYGAAIKYGKYHQKRFTGRKEEGVEGKVRIWRIA